ncbi:MAG: [protein-PII] uridylyltransferase [Deferribacterota bacterium]|nr:[protein-PII] uridylyltransferase [Deferribacterota bacterium]
MTTSLAKIKDNYWCQWQELKNNILKEKPLDILNKLTKLTDDTLKELIEQCNLNIENLVFIALGGYARKQLFPYSDIDLLILHKEPLTRGQENAIRNLITSIWDINIIASLQLKNLNEIITEASKDEIFKTSLLDNRFLIGSSALYDNFLAILDKHIFGRNRIDYLIFKIENVRKRSQTKNNTLYLLEPNLKESSGGLRDINTVYWICKLIFNSTNLSILLFKNILEDTDLLDFHKSMEFIFKIRIALHYFHKRKYDILNMHAQKYIANQFGYKDSDTSLAVEYFMKDYYKAAYNIQITVNKLINITLDNLIYSDNKSRYSYRYIGMGFYKYDKYITFGNTSISDKNKKNLILIFYLAAAFNLKIAPTAKEVIKKDTNIIDGEFIKNNKYLFLKIISFFPKAADIVNEMLETNILFKFIPQFKNIVCKTQFDYYHHYTVDAHTILALKMIDDLIKIHNSKNEIFINAFKELKRKDILALSILLHDIGKGQGKNHSQIGAKLAYDICNYIGLNSQDTSEVATLVENHLLMNHIAQRRDINDIDILRYFTNKVDNLERLNTLFLLTYADINAVGGQVYTDWVNTLIVNFYRKARKAILNKEHVFNIDEVVKAKSKAIYLYFNESKKYLNILNQMDKEYIYTTITKDIITHIKLLNKVTSYNPLEILVKKKDETNSLQFIICTFDYLGLLKNITAAFTAFNLNILRAEANTLANGLTIDTFEVIKQNVSTDELLLSVKEIKDLLYRVITNKIDPNNIIKETSIGKFEKIRPTQIKNKVEFDNIISNNYTIIDVFASDKMGLLYHILAKFEKLKLNVQQAKISTEADRVIDSFYVTDNFGKKIKDLNKLNEIKEALYEVIND